MARVKIVSYGRKDFRIDTTCAGGPGGQHQNKTQSAVRITHLPTGLSSECREFREQRLNKREAFRKLGALVREHHERLLRTAHVRTTETVRTYHEPDNRVVDHETGERLSYDEAMHKGMDRLIEARRRAQ